MRSSRNDTERLEITAASRTVAKWGNWRHCRGNKENFIGKWKSSEVSILEPYFAGVATREVIVGSESLQIKMAGNGWLKSIHHPNAMLMSMEQHI